MDPDPIQTLKWFTVAAGLGDSNAHLIVEACKKEMSAEGVREAERLAKEQLGKSKELDKPLVVDSFGE